jgi:hypothetical protein
MGKSNIVTTTLWSGVAAVAILAGAPISSADDPPPPPEPTSQQQQPPVDPASIAGSAADRVSQNIPPVSPYPTSGPAGGVCMRRNGFPIYVPPGGIETQATDVDTGPVHAGNCTSKDGVVGAANNAATNVAGAIPASASQTAEPSAVPPPP